MATPLPDRAAVTSALADLGLPAPVRIAPVGRSWRHWMWRIGFDPASGVADLLLRQPTFPEAGDTISPEIAALTALQGVDLPVVRRYRRLDGFSGPAAVSDLLPGTTGGQLLASNPAVGPAVVRAVGDVVRRLSEVRQPSFGTRAIGNRFVPTRSTWAESWAARVDRLKRQAAHGSDLGALSRRLEAAIDERLPALAGVMDFSVVHGDLQPGNLLFVQGPGGVQLSGLIDFESALAGDPLVDWALPMLVPDGTLGHVVEGYGRDAARSALSEPGAFARIELYQATHLLERLAFASGPHVADDPLKRNGAMAQAALLIREFLDGPSAKERLDKALEDGGSAVSTFARPALEQVLDRGLADALSRGAISDPAAAWTWVGSLRAVELARTAPMAREPWLKVAIALLERIDAPALRPAAPIGDRAGFVRELARATLGAHAGAQGGPGTALALLGGAVDLDDRLGGSLSDDAWRGVQEAVHGLIGLGVGWRSGAHVSDTVLLAHGAMGLAALASIGAVCSEPILTEVRAGFANQTGGAWSRMGSEASGPDLLDVLDAGPPEVGDGEQPALTPAICGALSQLEARSALPVAAGAIAVSLGLAGGS